MGRQGMSEEEQKRLDDFVRDQYRKKGASYKDDMCAADANLADIWPGKTVSCGAVAKSRKAIGIKFPKGRSKAVKPVSALKPSKSRSESPSSGDLMSVREQLVTKKLKVEAAIAAIDDAILAAEGLI